MQLGQSLGKREPPGSIYGGHKVPVEETIAIQHLLPDQGSDHVSDDFLYLVGICPTKRHVEGISVWTGIHIEQHLELFFRCTIVAQHVGDLSPCSQAA